MAIKEDSVLCKCVCWSSAGEGTSILEFKLAKDYYSPSITTGPEAPTYTKCLIYRDTGCTVNHHVLLDPNFLGNQAAVSFYYSLSARDDPLWLDLKQPGT